ncbi:MAG: hypothetical protein JWM11_781, partial [Planctomycetaceae bacterium]|nr:hypothetical protein [Planctomycetaceae bacterium]
KPELRKGVVVQLRIDYPRHILACRARVAEGEPPVIDPIQTTGSTFYEFNPSQLEPLGTTIQTPDGALQTVRMQMFSLKSKSMHLKLPLTTNDPMLLEWPVHALTTEPLRAFPFGRSEVSEQLQVILGEPLDFRSSEI